MSKNLLSRKRMETKRKIIIAVSGGWEADELVFNDAYLLGKEIAGRGYVLLTGGGGGVMEAASRGASENGGVVIGILPSERKHPLPGYPNKYVTIPIYTGMSDGRNVILAKAPDILVALKGGSGTLSEIALARKSGTPVIVLRADGFEAPAGIGCLRADSIQEVIRAIEQLQVR
jgi:uncharacterized protein (TIGR00725 family)